MRDFRHYVLLSFFALLLGGCSSAAPNHPSVVILLVEALGENDFLCSEMRSLEDLDSLKKQCSDLTRFTHAFVPSTLSQAVVASVMSGVEPPSHKVFHNGPQALSADIETLAEKAAKKGLKTAFFSGGVPILNKFGIHQGFEVFDHSFTKKPKSAFRPILQTVKASLKWLDTQVGSKPMFMTLYVPDRLYSKQSTKSNDGTERARDHQAQLIEIYESINELIAELEERGRWDNTFFVLAGVSGSAPFQGKSVYEINDIRSQKTHISLQIKPDKKNQSQFDKVYNNLLSLTDINNLISDLLFSNQEEVSVSDWLTNKIGDFLHIRSDWGEWRNYQLSPIEGLRVDKFLFSFTPGLKVYDSFADFKEVDPLPTKEALLLSKKHGLYGKMEKAKVDSCILRSYQRELHLLPRKPTCGEMLLTSKKESEKLRNFLHWRLESSFSDQSFSSLLKNSPMMSKKQESHLFSGWLSSYFLKNENWQQLLELAELKKNKYWKLIAKSNLEGSVKVEQKGCLLYFQDAEKHSLDDFYRHCGDSSLRKVVEGLTFLREGKKALKSFWHELDELKKTREAKLLNLDMMLINDVRDSLSFEPTLSELYFYLPKNKSFRKLIQVN